MIQWKQVIGWIRGRGRGKNGGKGKKPGVRHDMIAQ